MANDLKRYAVTKIISAEAYSLKDNSLLASTKHVKTFGVTDNTETSYLVGGENMSKLLAVMGQQEAQFTFTTATDSMDWKALQLNSKVETNQKVIPTSEYADVDSTLKVTVQDAVSISAIFVTDDSADGRDGEELVKSTTGTVATGEYSFDATTGELTFNSDMEGKEVHIFYDKQMEVSGYKSNGGKAQDFKFVATCIFTDVDTKTQHIGKYIAYQASLQQNDNTQADNGAVPSDVTYEISCMKSRKHNCVYEVVTCSRDDLAE